MWPIKASAGYPVLGRSQEKRTTLALAFFFSPVVWAWYGSRMVAEKKANILYYLASGDEHWRDRQSFQAMDKPPRVSIRAEIEYGNQL